MTISWALLTLLAAPILQDGAQADRAGNRLEPFVEIAPDQTDARCTEDRAWCARLIRDGDGRLEVRRGGPDAAEPLLSRPLEDLIKGQGQVAVLWPRIVRLADGGVLLGVEDQVQTMYSGGGGGARTLNLIRIDPANPQAAAAVFTQPISASLMIRACFGEQDDKARRGACNDEYRFGVDLGLAPETAAGEPRLTFEATAESWPRGVSRSTDSLERGPLTKADLVWSRDETCSYRRVFAWDPAAGAFTPDADLPECSDYTVP